MVADRKELAIETKMLLYVRLSGAARTSYASSIPEFIRRSGRGRHKTRRHKIVKREKMIRRLMIATAAALIGGGAILTSTHAADLYTPPGAAEAPPVEEAPPAIAETPPRVELAPPAVVVVPERRVIVESGCPTLRRCGYWGC